MSSNAADLTCDTLPGALSTVSAQIVWIESIITRSGFSSSKVVSIFLKLVSEPNRIGAVDKPKRSARNCTCEAASSPDMYKTFRPAKPNLAAACSNIVDLPIPGSPDSNIADELTSPFPRTRSNSAMPDFEYERYSWFGERSLNDTFSPFSLPIEIFWGPFENALLSSKVFQSPQPSQRPAHLLVTIPQDEQEYDFEVLAIPHLCQLFLSNSS